MKKTTGNRSKLPVLALVLLAIALGVGGGITLALVLGGHAPSGTPAASPSHSLVAPSSSPLSSSAVSGPSDESAPAPRAYTATPLPDEMRGVWMMFLEWEQLDWSTEASARAALGEMYANCAGLGLNTVICHVRPFGDALYQSDIYPWSHLLTGSQGQDPGYDPLAVMIEEAHARGLRFEALVNPYRIKHSIHGPQALSDNNPAVLHPEWVTEFSGNMMYDPGIPEVQDMITAGVQEIVQNYDVDGIHFDDYFYMEGSSEDFDAATYAQYGAGADKAQWRRDNISRMVQASYAAVKAANPTASFGISPAGNNENNYQKYSADVKQWLANPGYVDYIMPQIYWGFTHQTQSGRTDAAFDKKCAEWGGYPRHQSVRLYAGLGLYRIGKPTEDGTRTELGHGGAGDQSEWESGENMATQVQHLRGTGHFSGFSLYRYEYLFRPGDTLAAQEAQNLQTLLNT